MYKPGTPNNIINSYNNYNKHTITNERKCNHVTFRMYVFNEYFNKKNIQYRTLH